MSGAPGILVRTDASAAIGMGHAMRCLALAQAFADECSGRAVFLMAEPSPAFARRAVGEGASVVALRAAPGSTADAEETLAHAHAEGANWVVLDGYQFDGDYQRALVDGGRCVLALDDHGHAGGYCAHVVLNQNLGADAEAYGWLASHTRLLLGPRYALLRREFRVWDAPPRIPPARARRVLVTLGGSDPDDVSSVVLRALDTVGGPLEIQLLVGAANPHADALRSAVDACAHPVEVVVDALDMPRRMAWADLAVAGAGGSAWELARVGTPQIAIVIADNQRPAGRALGEHGAAVSLGWHADLTSADLSAAIAGLAADGVRRGELSRRGRALIDGRGALRVLAAMGLAGTPVAA